MKKIKKFLVGNIKTVVAFIVGIIISGTTVYAATILFASSEVSYDNTNSGLTSTNVQGAIDELYTKVPKSPTGCTTPPFNEGDYIQLIPSSKNYVVSSSLTGYTDQTINPSELTLWRVIKKNPCNVEVVSEYVSSTEVGFSGTIGYGNYVGALNEIARQYINKYTTSARCMGYDGQTEYISDRSAFDGTVNTPTSTTTTITPTTGTGVEYSGGVAGDTLYLKDYQLVSNVYKNDATTYGNSGLIAYKVGTTTATSYWIASRKVYYSSANYFTFDGRYVRLTDGGIYGSTIRYFNSSWKDDSVKHAIRPILILKSGITASGGSGTKDSPYTLS